MLIVTKIRLRNRLGKGKSEPGKLGLGDDTAMGRDWEGRGRRGGGRGFVGVPLGEDGQGRGVRERFMRERVGWIDS